MLAAVIRWSLAHRRLTLAAAAALLVWGAVEAVRMPVDVFPDLTAPTVTVLAEAHGMAPREVETQIVLPIEAALSGTPGVRRIRSIVTVGSAVIHADFDWGADPFRARQVVAEKLQLARSSLPPDLPSPILAPQASIMGEILFVAVTSDRAGSAEAMRTEADWRIRRRLLATPGVAEVLVVGGDQRQYQVVARPERLAAHGVTLDQVMDAARRASGVSGEGLVVVESQQYLVQGLGRVRSTDDLGRTFVAMNGQVPVLLRDVADVRTGRAVRRGLGSHDAQPAVVIGIQKQPGADTLALTRALDGAIAQLQKELPPGMTIRTDGFRQASFIRTSIDNLEEALAEGVVLVTAIVFLFLMSGRATLVTLAAIPLSVVAAILALRYTGAGVNTMTLGGLAIALGVLVDDAIIVVENVARRLRENAARAPGTRRAVTAVVFEAVREIQGSILFATLIIVLVFLPLFALTGVEGRLLAPLALAYIVALAASFLVAITATPALAAVLLPGAKAARPDGEAPAARAVRAAYTRLLEPLAPRWRLMAGASAALLVLGAVGAALAGRGFLPEFNEGVFTISAVTLPGTSLDQSDAVGRVIEQTLKQIPEVASTIRRTGRAELDEHAQSVEASEIDVTLKPGGRSKEAILAEMRGRLAGVRGVNIVIGQPISHRIDHMLSGTRSAIAVKIFGPELETLRRLAEQAERVARTVPGMADVAIEPQTQIPTLSLAFDREALATSGLTPEEAATALDVATTGQTVGRVLEGSAAFDVAVRYPEAASADPQALGAAGVPTRTGALVPFASLGELRRDRSPNMMNRENGERLIVVQANSAGRDLVGVVEDLEKRVAAAVPMPPGYRVEYGGQFESAASASARLFWLGLAVIAGIYGLLFAAFRSHRDAALVMLNLPLALVGGVAGMWLAGGVLSVATIVGFITLFGIATRNGVMLVSHIRWLVEHGEVASPEEAVRRGAVERVTPILMTALAAGLGLLPLALAAGQPGSEIQAPMAVVILCGLISSTALNMLVAPALYLRFGAVGRGADQGERR